ncbi:MAG: trigger factor [Candidatus Puniceispirillales bacterium]
MAITQTLEDGLKREFEIALEAADIEKRIDERIATLAGQVKMPGFRPGKVPVSIVKTRYGKQVLGEVIQAAMDEATGSIIKDNDFQLAANPSLNITEYEEGGDLKAVMAFEIMPEVPDADLSSISVDKWKLDISAKEVDQALEQLANENRPTKPIAKPRAVKSGDTVVIDFIGRVDGEAFEGGSAEGHQLKIGSNSFIPGFEDGLIGASADTTIDVNVTFPDEYPAEHLAGKASVFEVKVTEIREDDDIKLDDEFAKTFGMDDLAALKTALSDQLSRQHEAALRNQTKTSLLDALDDLYDDIEVPETLYDQEYAQICQQFYKAEQEHNHDHDHDHDHDHKVDENMSDDEKDEASLIAKRRVKLGIVLTTIGQKNKLQVSEEEKNRAIYAEAQRYPGQQKEVLEYFSKNPEAAQQLAGPIFENKVVDYILDLCKVTDKTVTAEELYKNDEFEDLKAKSKASAGKAKGKAKKAPAKAAAKKPAAKSDAKKPAAKKAPAKKAPAKKATSSKKADS